MSSATPGSRRRGEFRRRILAAFAIAAVTLGVFLPVTENGFVFDDVQYVTGNEHVTGGLTRDNFLWAWRTGYGGNWHPLTWLSHMADAGLFGLDAGRHHLVSLAWHAAAALLLFLFLCRATGSTVPPALAALLFAAHPLHVESVAWISERKDVLSAFFWMLTLLAYAAYARRPGLPRYLATAACLALGLMSKAMAVSLPFVLLLLDYWPLGRMGTGSRRVPVPELEGTRMGTGTAGAGPVPGLLIEKVPLFLMSAAAGAAAYVVQRRGGAVQSYDLYPFGVRLANALESWAAYAARMFWPARLAAFYPHPGRSLKWTAAAAAALILAAVTAAALARARKNPYFLVGWLWYAGTLVPVIGLVQVGGQAMADRYTYIPLVGLFLAVLWHAPVLLRRRPRLGPALAVLALLAVGALAVRSRLYLAVWRDDVSLFTHALEVTEDNWFSRNNLAGALSKAGRAAEAGRHFRRAMELNPALRAEAYFRSGEALFSSGRLQASVPYFREALKLKPDYGEAMLALGYACVGMGDGAAAREVYRDLRRIDPARADELLALIE